MDAAVVPGIQNGAELPGIRSHFDLRSLIRLLSKQTLAREGTRLGDAVPLGLPLVLSHCNSKHTLNTNLILSYHFQVWQWHQ